MYDPLLEPTYTPTPASTSTPAPTSTETITLTPLNSPTSTPTWAAQFWAFPYIGTDSNSFQSVNNRVSDFRSRGYGFHVNCRTAILALGSSGENYYPDNRIDVYLFQEGNTVPLLTVSLWGGGDGGGTTFHGNWTNGRQISYEYVSGGGLWLEPGDYVIAQQSHAANRGSVGWTTAYPPEQAGDRITIYHKNRYAEFGEIYPVISEDSPDLFHNEGPMMMLGDTIASGSCP